MFNAESYLTDSGEQKVDIQIHREDDGCFFVELEDINGNPVTNIGKAQVEMAIYDKARYYHPIIVIPMDKQTLEIHLSQKETRQFYFEHDYYYTLVFISETGKRYTFATGDIELIDDGRGEDYECCEDQIKWHCQYRGATQYW